MKTVNISVALDKSSPTKILLGRQGENKATKIIFDCNVYAESFGAGTAYLFHQRAPDTCPYPVAIEQDGNTIMWEVSASDTEFAGQGQCELFWYVDDIIAKTQVWSTTVTEALTGTESEEVPEAAQGWVSKVLQAIADIGKVNDEVVKAAVAAYIAENGLPDTRGVGFTSWSYDTDTGYIHLYNEDGEEAIEPLYAPGLGFADLTEDELQQVNTILTRASNYAAQAGQSREAAETSASNAAISAANAEESASAAAASEGNAAGSACAAQNSANAAKADSELAAKYNDVALGNANAASNSATEAKGYAETAEKAAQEAEKLRNGFVVDASLSMPGQAADAEKTGSAIKANADAIAKRFADSMVFSLPVEPAADTIYYIPSENSTDEKPLCLAYIYVGGKWAQIGGSGSGSLDADALANYYTKDEIDELLNKISLDGYYTKTQIDDLLKDIPTSLAVDEKIQNALASVGVSIKTITDEDGNSAQYLVNENDEILGEAIVSTGGGGSDSSASTVSLTLNSSNPSSVEYGKSCIIRFSWSSTYTDGSANTSTGAVVYQVKSGTTTTTCATRTISQGANSFDFGSYLRSGSNTIIIKVTDSEGTSTTRRASVTAQILTLEVDYDWTTVNFGAASVRWRVTGSSGVTFHASLANQIFSEVENPTVSRWQTLTVDPNDLGYDAHGVYRLRLWSTLAMDDGTTIRSSYTEFDLMFAEDGNGKVLIASDFSTEDSVQQYTSQTINYCVYDPVNEVVNVTRLVNGSVYAKDSNVNRSQQTWVWKPTESGKQTVSIRAGEGENQSTRNFVVTVETVAIPSTVQEYSTYEMKFNPAGHQNSDDNPLSGIGVDSKGNEIPCVVNDDFDWTNGGIQYDSVGNAYFCICPGDRLTIGYKPFETDFKASGGHIKICFDTARVSDRETKWLNCVDAAENGNNVGLIMTPIRATIRSEAESLSTRYMYDKKQYFDLPVVEMDINIQKYTAGSARNPLLQFWLEGCPAQFEPYDGGSDGWAQNVASDIIIGSDNCETHIYLMKVSKNSWEDEEIQDDWIMNAPSGEEMVSRYNRNNIYDSTTGEIDIDRLQDELIKAIFTPDDRLTTGKSDTVTGIMDFYWRGKHWKARVKIKAQGTTSSKYGESGLNWDVEIVELLESDDENMTEDGYYSMSGASSIAVNYFNVKVNVASSENWRNMFLADEFQMFNPHTRPARAADARVRDTMEFHPCIILINNATNSTITSGATSYAPGATGFYAIGNWGNSKKNFAALGEGTLSEYAEHEALVECSDNELSEAQEMHAPLPVDDDTAFGGGSYFEFRYPKSPTDTMRTDFRHFVEWVASTCIEDQYVTGNPLDEPYVVADGSVTYATNSKGTILTVYDGNNRARQVVESCKYDTETLTVDGETYTVLPLDSDGNEVCQYSYDTVAYRLEKFRVEFDDHLVFESLAHHYLETLANVGCDNREKNVFWGTEDGEHYHVDFAYDKDTNLGVNNSGALVQDFGYEDIDKVNGKNVFNGQRQTIWVNMRQLFDRTSKYYDSNFYGKMRSVFQQQESAGMWDTARRIKKILGYFNLIPEALWRDDCRKKYLNPYTENGTTTYLSMSNGPCLDQACQFMAEQELYMQSMWLTAAGDSRLAQMRTYTPESYADGFAPSSELSLKAFNKGYLVVEYGTHIPTPVRCEAGEIATFDMGDASLNDVAIYIPSAQNIAELGSVARMYPSLFNGGALTKCTKIPVGAGDGYYNPGLTSFSIGGCEELRELDVRGLSGMTGNLDSSTARELRTLLAQGSGFSGASFAPGGKLEIYHGGSNVSSLSANGLHHVQEFDLEDYASVSRVNITDSPSIDTASIVEQSANVARIRLTGINWALTSTELLNRLYDLRGIDASGNDTERAVLTGSVYVTRALESELSRYEAAWPLLEITCGESIPEWTVTYLDEDGVTVLRTETYENGATWVDPVASGAMEAPTKETVDRTGYTYSGWDSIPTIVTENLTLTAVYTSYEIVVVGWYQNDGETLIYEKSVPSGWKYEDPISTGEINTPTLESSVEYDHMYAGWDSTPTTVSEDIKIYATYTRTTRRYTVRWHNYGGATIQEVAAVAHSSVSYSGELNLTRPSSGDVQYLWLGEWDQDTSDIISDMDIYPVFLECVLPISAAYVPEGWFIYSDNPDDNMVYTREEFAAIMMSDSIGKYISIGDRIKMCINSSVIIDRQLTFSLHAYHHYRLSDSQDFSNTVWFMPGLLAATRVMNSSNINNGGWPATNLRKWLNETLYPTFPIFWRCLMKKVQILSSSGNVSADIVKSDDYLFIPSYAEMGFGITEQPYRYEVDEEADEVRFQMYTGNEQRIKKNSNGEGSASYYWTRSPYSGSSSSFCYINYNGGGGNYSAGGSYGVCVGLSI